MAVPVSGRLSPKAREALLAIERADASGVPAHRGEYADGVVERLIGLGFVYTSMTDMLCCTPAGIDRAHTVRDTRPGDFDGHADGLAARHGVSLADIHGHGVGVGAFYYAARLTVAGVDGDTIRKKAHVTGDQLDWIRSTVTPAPATPAPVTPTKETPMAIYAELPVTDLHPRPENLRVDPNGDDLVASIRQHGILQPLNVTANGDGWWVNAGHRRLDAAKKAGLLVVPCVVDDSIAGADTVAMVMLIENLQRRDLTPVEEARGYRRLVELGCTQREISDHVGVSTSVVSRRLRLLGLPDAAVERIQAGELTLELADAYTRLDPDVAEIAVDGGWDEHRVDDAVRKADQRRERDRLAGLAENAGVAVIPASKLGKWIPGSDTHKYGKDGGHWSTKSVDDPTVEKLAAVAARKGVIGVVIEEQWGGAVNVYPVIREKAAAHETERKRRQADGPGTAGEEAERRDALRRARVEHFVAWLDLIPARRWKAADAFALLTVAAVLVGHDAARAFEAAGVPDGNWDDRITALAEAACGLSGAALHKVMVALAADCLDYGGVPDEHLEGILRRFGFEAFDETTLR